VPGRGALFRIGHGHAAAFASQRTLSRASSSSVMPTPFLLVRAASRAASLSKFASSAPEYPGVPRAMMDKSTSGESFTFLA